MGVGSEYSAEDNPHKGNKAIARPWRAMRNSWDGLVLAVREESAFRQELLLAACLLPAALLLPFGAVERLLCIDDFEHVMSAEALRRNCDGVVCGHIHKLEIRTIDGALYCNDGDWIESMSALVETHAGELRLVHWRTRMTTPLDLGRLDGPPALVA